MTALELLEQGVSDGIMSDRDALLSALFGVPSVRRIVCNVLASQKRWQESQRPTLQQFEDWLDTTHPDTLASWYWQYEHYELDVFEALLDAKYRLI